MSLLRDYAAMTPVRVSGDPQDEEAWGFRARPAGNALWKEPEVFYAVGDRARCDQVRAGLGSPTEECWRPVYFAGNKIRISVPPPDRRSRRTRVSMHFMPVLGEAR